MSRHRIVRTMDYNDEYDGYDDVYGHSVDDDNCISPSDASQFIYDRARGHQSISQFMANNKNIEEEDENEHFESDGNYDKKRRDSENFQMPILDDIEQAKLMSCIEEIRSVVGDTISERQIVETSMKYDYDVTKVLDKILNAPLTREKEVLKPNKDSLEKDFRPNLSISNIKLKLPTLKSNGTGSSSNGENNNKLDDYIKKSFQNSNCDGMVSKQVIVVPKLKVFNSSEPGSPKLSQLINDNMNKISAQTSVSFNIPKLSSSLPTESFNIPAQDEGSPSTHELLLKKIMDSKKNNKQSEVNELSVDMAKNLTLRDGIVIDNPDGIIDLTQALSTISLNAHSSTITIEHEDEKFEIPFIDCDIPLKKPQFTHYCQTDMSGILKENLSNFIARPTNFGKILVMKYKCRSIPYVSHQITIKNKLLRFKFDTRSPDDIILSHLNKNRI